MPGRTWLVLGTLLGLGGVALGAFGAHGLAEAVKQWGLSEAAQQQRLHNWEVAVRYEMYHALALLVVGVLAGRQPSRWLAVAGSAFLAGVLVFSGCLYIYVCSGAKIWALIVPLGGVALLGGWLALLVAVLRSQQP